MRLLSQHIITRYIIRLREDGVLNVHVTPGKWDPEDNFLLFPAIGNMVNFRKVPLLLTHEKYVFPDSAEIAHYAKEEHACPYFKADGIVTNSMSLKILGNFFIKFHKPLRPTRLFEAENEAVGWLRTFL